VKAALVISERDNVATALEPLEPGRRLDLGHVAVVVSEPIPSGHKIALQAIAAGEPVVKYGSPIGTASVAIASGAHVHIHNVSSRRGRGDLELPTDEPRPRLAEPPDDSTPRQTSPTLRSSGE
jgi:altronate dehydratase